jgi:uncharacterized membrane protein
LHLLLNHLPVIGTIFGLLLLLFALLCKSEEVKRSALGVFVFAALTAVPTYLTGEPAEEVAEHLPGVTHALIESHEEAALFALLAIGLTGLVSLGGLWLARRAEKLPPWMIVAPLALALIAGGLLGWTANLGGQIRHTEIRQNATPAEKTGAEAKPKQELNREENEKEAHE